MIIHHLRTKHNIHPRTGSPLHYSHEESIINTLSKILPMFSLVWIIPPWVMTHSAGQRVAELRGGGTGERVGRGGKVRGPRGGNDERVDELNGQGTDQGLGANGA
ncbi:hypothetical protein Tco_0923531 [Tanacetum coccineum]|uniref:Uncharacterized protein n=1 Tax=Tanacetum coccineum TaxID=301880 RepID=A0ABQ5D2Q4_9ASTR